jgi:hypothetical protein
MSRDVRERDDAMWADLGIAVGPGGALPAHTNGFGKSGEAAAHRLLRAARVALGREP